MRYLLDTNIVSDITRHPHGHVIKRIAQIGEQNICTSIVVAMELCFGVAKKGSAKLAGQVDSLLEKIDILPLSPPADQHYATLRAQLEKSGTPIGANDMLIAAHALALGCVLVTDNKREFTRIKSLKVENWLR
jgi:tRNA(fMet)-specific endonuclease VapC